MIKPKSATELTYRHDWWLGGMAPQKASVVRHRQVEGARDLVQGPMQLKGVELRKQDVAKLVERAWELSQGFV